jgi:geranylgeranyl diphosphate synthase type 3
MLNLHRGQGRDIQWRDSSSCPTESQYISMVTDKTGGLFRLAVGLLQCFATTNKDVNFVPLVNNLGLYFQIRDDLINLADEEYMKSKSFCEDLTEGKFSLPIIHCIRSEGRWKVENGGGGSNTSSSPSSASAQLVSILKQRTEDVDVKRYAQRLLSDAGSLRYTREKCTELRDSIVMQIAELGGNKPLMNVIDMLDVQLQKMAEQDKKMDVTSTRSSPPSKGLSLDGKTDETENEDPTMNLDYT